MPLKLFSLFPQIPGNVEYYPKYMVYSKKQNIFLVVYEFSGATNEVVLYWENTDSLTGNSKSNTVKGFSLFGTFFLKCFSKLYTFHLCNQVTIQNMSFLGRDGAFIGPNENQFAILDDDKTGVALYMLPGSVSQEANEKNVAMEENQSADTKVGSIRGPMQFMFDNEVDRIFSTPLGAWEKKKSYMFNILLYIV